MGFALVLLALGIGTSQAGEPCSGVKLKTDDFTHSTTAAVNYVFYTPGWYAKWTANFNGGQADLTLSVPQEGVQQVVLNTGYTVQFLMEDGAVIALDTVEDSLPAPQAGTSKLFTNWTIRLPLEKDEVTALSAQKVTAMRTTLPAGDITWKTIGKGTKLFQRAFTCYSSLMP